MNDAEREKTKEGLRAAIASAKDGIDIDTQFRYCVKGIAQPELFIRNLLSLLPSNAILYFEGCMISRDVAAFYQSRAARNLVPVVRDTVFPEPEIYHVECTPDVISRLSQWAAERPSKELFDHIKAYREKNLLFTFHDAFAGDLYISELIPERVVAEFCRNLIVSCEREPNVKRDSEALRRFLDLMENAHKFRIGKQPWWKRVLRRMTGK